MDVCNRRLFSIPSKVEMAEEQEYLYTSCNDVVLCCTIDDKSNLNNCKFQPAKKMNLINWSAPNVWVSIAQLVEHCNAKRRGHVIESR